MSEALTRLASRALGLGGTVRPRPASRFSDGGMDQPLPDFAGEPLVETGQAAPERAMPSRSPANAERPITLAAGDAVSAPQAAQEGEPLASRLMAQPTPLPDATPSRQAPLPANAALPVNPLRTTPVAEAAAWIEAAPVAPDRADPEPFPPASTETSAVPYRPLLPPRADPAAPAAPAIPAAPPPATPDIQISIGRIEVRAEKPEPRRSPAAPPRARPALMSLDDYLARGRGRR